MMEYMQSIEDPLERYRAPVRNLVSSAVFDGVLGILVAINAVCLLVESELQVGGSGTKLEGYFKIADLVFLGVFTAELLMRVFGFGLGAFHSSPALMLDLVIVITGWLTEVILPTTANLIEVNLQVIQSLKILRVLRAVRVLRVLTMFQDLWKVVQAFFLCLRPLVWTVLFILIIIFLFAMFAVELIGRGLQQQAAGNPDLQFSADRFRSTVPAMVTLFQIMTLDSWHKTVRPLFAVAPWTHIFFLVWIAVSSLALMNLVTAVVVESATRGTEQEEEFKRNFFDSQVQRMTDEIEDCFELMDEDGSGYIDETEFSENALQVNLIRELCETLSIREREMPMLFKVLHSHEHGSTSIDLEQEDEPELHMAALLQGIFLLQRITNDQSTVALLRAARSEEERYHHLRRAFSGLRNEMNKLRGSVRQRVEGMSTQVSNIIQQIQPLSNALTKTCESCGVNESHHTAVKKRRSSCGSNRSIDVSGIGGTLESPAPLPVTSMKSGPSLLPPPASQAPRSPRSSERSRAAQDELQSRIVGELSAEVQELSLSVQARVQQLCAFISQQDPSVTLSTAASGYGLELFCAKFDLPAPLVDLLRSEGISNAHELAVLPSTRVHQLLERPEAGVLTLGQRGGLLLELEGLRCMRANRTPAQQRVVTGR